MYRDHLVYNDTNEELLEVNDKKLYSKCISDIEHPLNKILPEKKTLVTALGSRIEFIIRLIQIDLKILL